MFHCFGLVGFNLIRFDLVLLSLVRFCFVLFGLVCYMVWLVILVWFGFVPEKNMRVSESKR